MHSELIPPMKLRQECARQRVDATDAGARFSVQKGCRGEIHSQHNPHARVSTVDTSCNPQKQLKKFFDGGMHSNLCAADVDFWLDLMDSNDRDSGRCRESHYANMDAIWGVSVGIPCHNVSIRKPQNAISASVW